MRILSLARIFIQNESYEEYKENKNTIRRFEYRNEQIQF